MTLFELVAKITADSSGFDKAVNQADKKGKSLKDSLGNTFDKIGKFAVAAFSGAAIKKCIDTLVGLANDVAAAGDKIDKQSQVLGMSRRAYQEWDYILSQNGASIDSMSTSIKTMNNLLISAAEGGEEAKDTFAELGINIHELEGMKPEQQFEAIIRAFQKMPSGAQKSALAVKIFGRAGMDLLPLLNASSDSIDTLRENAENLGFIMSDEAVDASVAYTDAMDDMRRTFGGIKNTIVAQFLPKFTAAMKSITAYAGKLKKAYDQKGLAGVWETLVQDWKKIKWPTWKDVAAAVTSAWNTVVNGVASLPGLIFGKKADGTVDWPTWEEVQQAAIDAWNKIKEGALNLGGLIFGRRADGSVAWPTWDDVQEKAHQIWTNIKKKAREIGGIVFGKNADGTVAWPDLGKLAKDFSAWWETKAVPALKKVMVWSLTLFGMPKEKAEEIANVVGKWWSGVVDSVTSVLNWALHLPESPYEAGQQLAEIIGKWWGSVKSYAEGVLKWIIGLFDIGDSDGTQTKEKVKKWWDEKVVPLLRSALRFVLGLFGLPDVDGMVASIKLWWYRVKNGVGQLILNATVNPVLGIFGHEGITLPGQERVNSSEVNPEEVQNAVMNANHGWKPFGFAKGTNYVPYDMIAQLHRGEQVLTASQARHRNGGGADIGAVASAMVAAVQEGMSGASVNSYLDGKRVTGSVNRRTLTQLRSRRFAVS